MDIDIGALVQRLQADPEQRDALRRALLGEEADVHAALTGLAEAQRRTEARLEALTARVDDLAAAQRRTEARLEALTARVDDLAQAQRRTEQRLGALTTRVDALTARVDTLAKQMHDLAEAQQRTEDAVKSLVDVVAGMNDRVAKLDGDALERRYRERGHAYFMPLARRLQLVDLNRLSVMVDDAREAGLLSAVEASSLMQADAVFAGRSDDGELVHLVVEASVTLARHDVRRARERADLLGRIVGTPVLAVVAGEYAPEPVTLAAQDAGVWRVTDGRAVGPDDDAGDRA